MREREGDNDGNMREKKIRRVKWEGEDKNGKMKERERMRK